MILGVAQAGSCCLKRGIWSKLHQHPTREREMERGGERETSEHSVLHSACCVTARQRTGKGTEQQKQVHQRKTVVELTGLSLLSMEDFLLSSPSAALLSLVSAPEFLLLLLLPAPIHCLLSQLSSFLLWLLATRLYNS